MIDASPADRQSAKEIMIAYIAALGVVSEYLFRKDTHLDPKNQSFAETWETILKTVSDHD